MHWAGAGTAHAQHSFACAAYIADVFTQDWATSYLSAILDLTNCTTAVNTFSVCLLSFVTLNSEHLATGEGLQGGSHTHGQRFLRLSW